MTTDEYLEKLDAPKPFHVRVWRATYWPVWRFFDKIRSLPRETKWKLQRARRGWSDADTWSIDGYFLDIIGPMIRKMRSYGNSYPGDLTGAETPEKWDKILDEMASGFELKRDWEYSYCEVMGVDKPDFKDPKFKEKFEAKNKEVDDKFNNSMALFTKWFGHLWD